MNLLKIKGCQLPVDPTLTVFIANDNPVNFTDIIIQYFNTESGERVSEPEWVTDTIRALIGKWLFNQHQSNVLTLEWINGGMIGKCKGDFYANEAGNAMRIIKFYLNLL